MCLPNLVEIGEDATYFTAKYKSLNQTNKTDIKENK